MQDNDVIKAMEAHAKVMNVKLTTLGQMAVKSRKAYERIKNGTAHRDTLVRMMQWIEADKKARSEVEARP